MKKMIHTPEIISSLKSLDPAVPKPVQRIMSVLYNPSKLEICSNGESRPMQTICTMYDCLAINLIFLGEVVLITRGVSKTNEKYEIGEILKY
jgi:hypothetical protein